ncbi:MAG: hypothetical protein AAGF23_23535 [Acidobacteriota bacterium]
MCRIPVLALALELCLLGSLAGTAAWGQGPFLRAEKNVGLAVDADDDGRP